MLNEKFKGFFFGALAAIAYGMNPLFTLPLYNEGLTPESVLFYRYFFAVLLLGAWMKTRKKSFRLPLRMVLPVAGSGLLMGFSSLFLFLSYRKMDAGIASTILFVYPVMVAAIMGLIFHEKITSSTITGILGALAGVFILYRGGSGPALNFTGLMLVLGSALTYAVYMVAIRESSIGKLPVELLTFYVMLFGVPVFLVSADFGLALQGISSFSAWSCTVALALLPTILSFLLMTLAIGIIGATKTAILGALEPATAVFFGVLLFGEQLTFRLMFGIAVILLSVTVVVTGKQLSFLGKKFPLKGFISLPASVKNFKQKPSR